MLGSRKSSYSSSRGSSSRRYRLSGYPPPSTFPSLMSYTNGGHHKQHHSSSPPTSSSLTSLLGHHHGSEVRIAAASSSIMSDGHSETSETPTRKRIAVACGRCRKRKIRCSGDTGGGQPCVNCRNAGNEPCQFLRVQSQLTPIRHENEGGNSTSSNPHLGCGYNIEVSRAAAHRGSMPPLPMPSYAVELAGEVAYQPRPSYSSGYSSRPSAAAASSSYYTAGSGTWSSGYSTDEEYQAAAPYYSAAMSDLSGYSTWGGSSSGSASGTRSSSRSGPAAGSMYVDPPAPAPAPAHAPALTHAHAHVSHPTSRITPVLHPHHLSSLVHRPAIPTSAVAAAAAAAVTPATASMPASTPVAVVVSSGHQGQQGIPQNFPAVQYSYPSTPATGVISPQSCGIVYMPQPTALRLGSSSQFMPDGLPSERLTTSPSNSPSPHAQLAAAAPTAPYPVQPTAKVEGTASSGPSSNRASTSPARSSTTPRTSIGSVASQEEQKSQDGGEPKQDGGDDQPLKSPTATSHDMPQVANLSDTIFSDSLHASSMASYDYADSSSSSAYHNAASSTAGTGSGSGSGSHRRGMSSMGGGHAYVPLPTPPPPPSSHHPHHPHHPHHASAAGSHPSSYAYNSHYQGPGYHQHSQHASAAEHHHPADHHRSSMGHRR